MYKFSSLEPLDQFQPNLAENILGCSAEIIITKDIIFYQRYGITIALHTVFSYELRSDTFLIFAKCKWVLYVEFKIVFTNRLH